ncbi:FAD:protein FMN transferase [Desertibaculum subflavum]|uniref:FAD:protein FMN transferase n=1 Tax=Desertibaculum subflavum TaxID=2268458 RepID=UPI000E66B407
MDSATSHPSRRRAIGILAAAAGLPLLPLGAAAERGATLVEWRGTAMGAVASLLIHHHDRAEAQRFIGRAVAEVARLEAIFSLYRRDSALVRLNERGVLEAPPPELVALLQACGAWHQITGGAFDPTVQPLWRLYAEHFSRGAGGVPGQQQIDRMLGRIGFQHVLANRDRIVFARRGMALTLNGIAQGYITDRVVELLRVGGITQSFVDIGEGRAIGARPDGAPWQVAIADPVAPGQTIGRLPIVNRAVATSSASGFRFDMEGRFNHLLDPRSGACATRYRSVTVVASTATDADAFSTGCSLISRAEIEAVVRERPELEVRLVTGEGHMLTITA